MTNAHHLIPQGRTHRDTATTIYDYLRAHPEQWPNDEAARAGTGHFKLKLTIGDTSARLAIGELTDSWLDVFPDNVPWSEDRLSRGVMFTKKRLLSEETADREQVIGHIRTALMRSLRYAAKRDARMVEINRQNTMAEA